MAPCMAGWSYAIARARRHKGMSHAMKGWKMDLCRTRAMRSMVRGACHGGFGDDGLDIIFQFVNS